MIAQNLKISEIEVNKGQVPGLPKNPRFIKDERFKALVKSIQDAPEMLNLRELLVYPHNGKYVVIGGNMRLRACKELGYKEVPCKILDASTDVAKLREYTIKDNNAFGSTDWDLIANEWECSELEEWGMEIPDVEFSGEEEEKEIVEDEAPAVDEVEPVCKKGDIWKLGRHRLMCGDSTDKGCVEKLMNGKVADITFSSPPYNMMAGGFDNALKNEKVNVSYNIANGTYNEFNDKLSDVDYENLLKKTLDLGLSNSDDVLFNIGILSGSKKGIIGMLNSYKDKFLDILVWNKNNSIPLALSTSRGMVSHRCELIFCFNKKGTRCFSHPQWDKGVYKGEVMHNRIDSRNASNNEYGKIHHATFPVEFAAQIIERFSEKSVIDFFGGTGTTLIACEQLNRTCYMMELDPKYCDVIIARWEKLTNQKATKIN